LVGGHRDLPPRHRMLRDAIEWSYDLLDPGEQTLFRRLGVFVGGFTLSSTEAVCNSGVDLPIDVLDGLGSLLSNSLLQRRRDQQGGLKSEARFSMLETIREYALERLTNSGEEEAIRCVHTEYFLALAEAGDVQLRGPEQTEWLARLETEHGNFRGAMNWALTQGEVELGLQLAGELGWFWELRGHYTEGRERLASALALYPPPTTGKGHTAVAARALNSAGRLAYAQGDIHNGRLLLDEALAIATELDDKWLMLLTLHNLGNVASAEGNEALARTYYEESLVAAREYGDPWGLAWALMGMGYICINGGDYEGARIYFEESLEVRRGMRDRWGIARSFTELGATARLQGDYHKARAFYDESQAIHEELGHKGWVSNLMYSLGHVALHLGEYTQAEEQFKGAMTFYTESGDRVSAASCIAGFGLVAYYRFEKERAATLFGAAGSIHRVSNYHIEAFDRAEFEAAINSIREAATGNQVIADAWAAGEKMTLEEAIDYAL
ncbi:MAG: tetratricopeptide repeat protein, partial [Chloroflexia bacterium]